MFGRYETKPKKTILHQHFLVECKDFRTMRFFLWVCVLCWTVHSLKWNEVRKIFVCFTWFFWEIFLRWARTFASENIDHSINVSLCVRICMNVVKLLYETIIKSEIEITNRARVQILIFLPKNSKEHIYKTIQNRLNRMMLLNANFKIIWLYTYEI